MKAEDLDKKFDSGEDITRFLDVTRAKRPGQDQKRVNVDFPVWMIQSLDREAKRLGVPRQSIIKIWIAEKLKENADVKEFYLGLTEVGKKKRYRDVKHYKRRKRWLT